MKYGLITYDIKKHFNIGDYIQSVAARQFLPQVDEYINRHQICNYSGPKIKIIMNGWFMHHPENWPPSPDVIPFFISFHLTQRASKAILSQEKIGYLKKFKVGARDQATLNLLKEKGVDSFFSGCLTLTLGTTYQHSPGNDIYFVDVLHKWNFFGQRKRLMKKIFGKEVFANAKFLKHNYDGKLYKTEDSRFKLADDILKKYQNAKLVVTSRLHCALPCLAMGTPVVFVDGYTSDKDKNRFVGLRNFLNTVTVGGGKIEKNFDLNNIVNKDSHLEYVEKLQQECRRFIRN